ncbi:MAG: amidohydrolase family protein [Rhodospirillaceae bacterium]|nr:amidohydrolase family protein [Rhodospirillaceae bacterium]MBT4687506.1 amidohydrolase family protein [Rhodospirillaceae bacterium]MBT5527093.1 amidohydrolase family protein [Rhodospirillaceae bacterium]MBT5881989.1 amidohydrolase family protein [Rhodospirillaceae bacterium]MBT6590584.1 amidohydrolase family protein [Rhodospirillaceae bacterium]
MTPDFVIRNGTIFDGLGKPGAGGDVVVREGRIVSLGASLGPAEVTGAREIDATGLYVTPGFIDIHSHSDFTLLVDPRAQSAVHQGVTLEVIGNCGHGCFPLVDKTLARNTIYGISDAIELDWSTPSAYLDRLEAAKPAINVLTLVPNGQLRQATVGLSERPADPEEQRQMLYHLEEALEAGAYGLSTGLEYPIEMGADQAEIAALLQPVARQGLLYASHTRKRDVGALAAIEEALATSREAGVRLQISHLLPRGGRVDCEASIEMVNDARHRGHGGQDVAFDMHTRDFSLTFLHAMLPPWALQGGLSGLAALLEAAGNRDRIHKHPSIVTAGGWERVTLLDNDVAPEYARQNFSSIGQRMDLPPGDAALALLCRSANAAQPLMIIRPVYAAADQDLAFAHDLCMPGSDATALCPDGPLEGSAFHGAYSWAAWFYRFTVLERGFLSPEAAVHKLTGQPADVLNLTNRGVLAPGAWADIAIFDPDAFGETATLWQPNQIASGMKFVLVNGALVLDHGENTNTRPGQVLRQGQSI